MSVARIGQRSQWVSGNQSPTAAESLAVGYRVGDDWVRTDTAQVWRLTDETPGTWTELTGGGGGGGAVSSVFGRTGAVVAVSTDYAAHYQPLGSDLTAVEALASTGLAARTAANTWALRAVAGTTDEILVTNGAGTAGDPTIGLASNPTIPGNGGLVLPTGTTAQRGASTAGRLRASTTLGVLEYYSGAGWEQLASESYVTPAGAALVTGARRLALFGGL